MTRLFTNPALDIPTVGRIILLSRDELNCREEAAAIVMGIVTVQSMALLERIKAGHGEGLKDRPPFPQEVYLYDGDKLVGKLKPGRDGGEVRPSYEAVQ